MAGPRCNFISNEGRCRRKGYGNPPFCEEHADDEASGIDPQAVIDALLENKQVQKGVGKLNSFLDKLVNVVDRVATGDLPTSKPNNKPAVKEDPTIKARIVLHFGPKDALTKELIKDRRQQLAKLAHPDKQGGSTEAMQVINQAADILIAAIK